MGVATVNSIQLAYSCESGDARAYGRHPQTDLVGSHRVVPIKIFARGGDFDPAPPTQCAAKKISEEARVQQFRSSEFCRALSDCAMHCECLGNHRAGDGVVTLLKEEHENSAPRTFSSDRDCLPPHVHSRRAKGSVRPCRNEMTLDVESVVGCCMK